MPGKRTRDSLHHCRPIDPAWDVKCEETWQHLLARAEAGGTFTAKQLFSALGVGYDRVRPVLDRAMADGRLVHVSARYGYTRPGLVPGAVTLETLLATAAQSVDPEAKGTPGRRATDVRERVETLTPSQFTRMRAAAAVAARAVGGDRGLAGVGSEHFGWVPCATGELGRGVWNLVDVVARASDEQARAAHQAACANAGVVRPWDPSRNKAAREAHTGGIRLLLNWAYTHGHIASMTRLGAEYGVHAAELQPWVDTMTAVLCARAKSRSMRYAHADGVRVLALHRTHTKQFDDEHVDWVRVIDNVEAAQYVEVAPLSPTKVTNAKGAYRALHDAGPVTGPGWGARAGRTPEGLVGTAVIKHTAKTGDFSAWRVRRPTKSHDEGDDAADDATLVVPTALVSDDTGARSLRRYYQWADGRNSDAALMMLGLPSRAYLDPDRQQAAKEIKARNKGQPLFHNCVSTLGRNLGLLNPYAGWAAAEDGVDFTQQGLEALVDEARFARYCVHWQALHPEAQARGGRAAMLKNLAALLGTIASPFLARTAQNAGDADEAARLVQCAREFFLRSLELKPRKNEVSSGKQKLAAWELRGDDTEAIDRLRAIAEAMIEDIERLGGGSIQQQINAIQAGTHRVSNRGTWAALVRDTEIILCQCRVALRPGNVCALRHTGVDRTWFVEAGRSPWEGWISYEFPERMMKTCEPFTATLISARDAHAEDAVAHLRPDVLELLLMPGGARDILLTHSEGGSTRVAASDFVFVSRAQYGKPKERAARIAAGCPMTVQGLGAQLKQRIRQYARHVGLDPRALLAVYGAATTHVCRAIAYTAAARAGEAGAGARGLGHADGGSTATLHYLGERGATPDELRRRRTGAGVNSTAPCELIAHALALVAAGKLSPAGYEATVLALQPAPAERAA